MTEWNSKGNIRGRRIPSVPTIKSQMLSSTVGSRIPISIIPFPVDEGKQNDKTPNNF